MKVSELRAILVSCPDDAEVFLDFPEQISGKLESHFGMKTFSLDSFSMSIEEVNTSWGSNDKVVTIIPDEIIRC